MTPPQTVEKASNLGVIANQPAGWCGNPLQTTENLPIINKKCLKIQGIPTPLRPQARAKRNRRRRLLARRCEALARNDTVFRHAGAGS